MKIERTPSRRNTGNCEEVVPERQPGMLWSNAFNTLSLDVRDVEDFDNRAAHYDYNVELTPNDIIAMMRILAAEGVQVPELREKLNANVDALAGLLALACGKKMVPIKPEDIP